MKIHFLVALLFSFTAHLTASAQKIVFVGNSLTYANDLPKILEYIAADFDETIETSSLCFPNYGLEDHWKEGKLQRLLSKEVFDYVIVQQGPSSQMAGKKMLVEYGTKIKNLCNEKGIQLAYFMVWPSKPYYHTFDSVIENYIYAAKITESIVLQVGSNWKKYQQDENNESLYAKDNFHPSTVGSLLAALTIFHQLHPEKNLESLKFKKYNTWVSNETSFNMMVQLIGAHIKKD